MVLSLQSTMTQVPPKRPVKHMNKEADDDEFDFEERDPKSSPRVPSYSKKAVFQEKKFCVFDQKKNNSDKLFLSQEEKQVKSKMSNLELL